MKNLLYKFVIDDVTLLCYENCLNYFPRYSRILDVGIGNGIMIEKYHSLIRHKELQITGIDINQQYLAHCNQLIDTYNLQNNIKTYRQFVEAYQPPANDYFDFVLFSMSFMLFQNQELVLDRVKSWVRPNGKIIFFQTMFKEKSRIMDFIKPKLKYVTTVDFGKVTYEEDFFHLLQEKDIAMVEDFMLKREWFKGEYHMIITSPNNGASSC